MAIDTLKIATKMKKAGMPEEQANVLAESLNQFTEGQVATKLDVEKLRGEIRKAQIQTIMWVVGLLIAQTAFLFAILH